ncbi:MAG: hypothetical protein ACI4TK_03530 [Agathobacter sp.]
MKGKVGEILIYVIVTSIYIAWFIQMISSAASEVSRGMTGYWYFSSYESEYADKPIQMAYRAYSRVRESNIVGHYEVLLDKDNNIVAEYENALILDRGDEIKVAVLDESFDATTIRKIKSDNYFSHGMSYFAVEGVYDGDYAYVSSFWPDYDKEKAYLGVSDKEGTNLSEWMVGTRLQGETILIKNEKLYNEAKNKCLDYVEKIRSGNAKEYQSNSGIFTNYVLNYSTSPNEEYTMVMCSIGHPVSVTFSSYTPMIIGMAVSYVIVLVALAILIRWIKVGYVV